jgi:hypothetical protein
MPKLFQLFLTRMQASFRRIARRTKNEVAVEDLHNDAWVMALEIGDRRGRPIDFDDPADQDLVMAALHVQNVKRGDWNMRCSLRIEQESNGEEGGLTLAERLPAQASSDPLIYLLVRETTCEIEEKLQSSYSQAAAYVIAFNNLDNNRQKIRAYLVISDSALARRFSSAVNIVRAQPSIFDHVERIPLDFMPTQGKVYVVKQADERDVAQWEWNFGDELVASHCCAFDNVTPLHCQS